MENSEKGFTVFEDSVQDAVEVVALLRAAHVEDNQRKALFFFFIASVKTNSP